MSLHVSETPTTTLCSLLFSRYEILATLRLRDLYSSDDNDVLFWHLADEVLLRFEFQ